MERNCNLNDISDGKFYGLSDMAKVGCNDCQGCSACCQGMGNSIVLDPLDIYELTTNLKRTLEELLLSEQVEMNVVDGMILPNLKMVGTRERCTFLNEEGRCTIHGYRPGICRIFPLGRVYENRSFQYILQVHECKKATRTKVKVSKWIDTPNLKKNQEFINDWHYFIKELQSLVKKLPNGEIIRQLNVFVLNTFYRMPYDAEKEFYEQFETRFREANRVVTGIKLDYNIE